MDKSKEISKTEATMDKLSVQNIKPFHMNFSKVLMTLIGLWPWKLNGNVKILYNTVFHLTFWYFVLFNVSQTFQAYLTFGENWLYTAIVLNVNINYILNIYKALICRSATIKKFIGEINEKEIYYLTKCDEYIKNIYKENAIFNTNICRIDVLISASAMSLYVINPVISDLTDPFPVDNITGIQPKRLIYSNYFPFDENRHHLTAYWMQFFAGFVGYAYVIFISTFFISTLNFIIGRIKILQYRYEIFNSYCAKIIKEYGKTSSQAQLEFFEYCIKEHIDILRFTSDFNDCLKMFCLLEYLISSLQLSLVIFQMLVGTGPIIGSISAFGYFITLSLQLALFYWCADEITAQAIKIGDAIFTSDWYDCDIEVRKMLSIVILRSQKPVAMTIGPMENMTVPALFQQWHFAGGILGAGKISFDFVAAVKTLPEADHKVVAAAGRNKANVENFSKKLGIEKWYDDYKKLAEDPNVDVIYIGNLNHQHFESAKLALEHNKHVLCEKPCTLNEKQTSRLIQIAKERKLFFMEAVWSRCFPAYKKLEEVISSGEIGDVLYFNVQFGFPLQQVDRLKSKDLGGGAILDLGVYVLQLQQYIFRNLKPLKIVANGHLNEDKVDESCAAVLTYPDSKLAVVSISAKVQLPNEAVIIGTKGTIKLPTFWCPTKLETPSNTYEWELPTSELEFNFHNSSGLSFEAEEVRQCIRAGKIESARMPHEESIGLAKYMDFLRKEVGVVFPEDSKDY